MQLYFSIPEIYFLQYFLKECSAFHAVYFFIRKWSYILASQINQTVQYTVQYVFVLLFYKFFYAVTFITMSFFINFKNSNFLHDISFSSIVGTERSYQTLPAYVAGVRQPYS